MNELRVENNLPLFCHRHHHHHRHRRRHRHRYRHRAIIVITVVVIVIPLTFSFRVMPVVSKFHPIIFALVRVGHFGIMSRISNPVSRQLSPNHLC